MINNNWKTILIALCTSVASIAAYKISGLEGKSVILNESSNSRDSLGNLVNYDGMPSSNPGDFTYAAGVSAPGVVHIKATSTRAVRQRLPSVFDDFFGMNDDFFGAPRNQEQESSGSGVIISNDGYIVTNNHVVDGSNKLEVVTYDKKTFTAEVVGVDPSTDIAVIKIDAKDLPSLTFGNSDEAKVGEWVLAVGNPFNLESTVTAGIISAIGRDISILRNSMQERMQKTGEVGDSPIESFIQTDAAVNPGNSGGALVNLRGELLGINTAIASPNGAFAGYSFAVPASTVKKVTADLIKFGNVQRGYLGVQPMVLDAAKAKEVNAKINSGIYVEAVTEDGAANAAGVKAGDIIVKIDDIAITSEPRFRELIGRKRPGDEVELLVNRDGKEKKFTVTLRNRDGGKTLIKKEETDKVLSKLGVDLQSLTEKEKSSIGLKNGVKVKQIFSNGSLARDTDIKAGFIVTRVGNTRVDSEDDFKAAVETAIKNKEEGVLICGVYEGVSRNFCYGIPLGN